MTEAQRLQIRSSEIREKLNTLAGTDELTDEQRQEIDTLTTEYRDVEVRMRAAIVAEGGPETRETETVDSESTASGSSCATGRRSAGSFSPGCRGDYRPGSYTSMRLPAGRATVRSRSICSSRIAPSRCGRIRPRPQPSHGRRSTCSRIAPYVLDRSIAGRLGIAMPSVGSGSHVETTITVPLTAGPMAKGAARESTAATLTPITATARRISARLSIAAEDVAQIGVGNFESSLRENLSMALADSYDAQCISGNGTAPNVTGLIKQLTAPDAPSDVVTFDTFVSTVAGFVDGKWAMTTGDVVSIVNPETYRLSAATFQTVATGGKGEQAASSYLQRESGGWSTAARMPATPTTGARAKVASALVYLRGRPGLRTAVHPTWGSLQITDIYTDSAPARRTTSRYMRSWATRCCSCSRTHTSSRRSR